MGNRRAAGRQRRLFILSSETPQSRFAYMITIQRSSNASYPSMSYGRYLLPPRQANTGACTFQPG
jgi:hypothetical protein